MAINSLKILLMFISRQNSSESIADGTDILIFVKGDEIFNSEAAISFRRLGGKIFNNKLSKFSVKLKGDLRRRQQHYQKFLCETVKTIIELAFSYKNVDDFFPKLKFCHIHEPSK